MPEELTFSQTETELYLNQTQKPEPNEELQQRLADREEEKQRIIDQIEDQLEYGQLPYDQYDQIVMQRAATAHVRQQEGSLIYRIANPIAREKIGKHAAVNMGITGYLYIPEVHEYHQKFCNLRNPATEDGLYVDQMDTISILFGCPSRDAFIRYAGNFIKSVIEAGAKVKTFQVKHFLIGVSGLQGIFLLKDILSEVDVTHEFQT